MTDPLFSGADLRDVLTAQEQALSKEIGSLSEDRVLIMSPADLCDYFVEKYRVEPVVIDESDIKVDYGDAQIDVSRRFEYAVFDGSGPAYVTGTRITFFVPFSGDPGLFKYRPSTFSLNPPRGVVRGNELVFSYDRTTQDVPNIGNEFEQEKQKVKQNLSTITNQVEQFNSTIRPKVSQHIGNRREKLLQDRGIVENLGFPLKRRSGVPTTYASPEVKRRIVPKLPAVSSQSYKPEPTLDLSEYEHILSVISNMVLVMERSPSAFKDMGEEALRQHFLVQLNGQYEGQATGETFNYEGKTDILIRAEGRNIFIAECKFWTGSAGLEDALDQLLGYASWRDTKMALVIFNRDTTMSTVLQRVPEAVREHPNHKADLNYDSETGFRYVFRHRDDPDRELTLTVLVFDIPGYVAHQQRDLGPHVSSTLHVYQTDDVSHGNNWSASRREYRKAGRFMSSGLPYVQPVSVARQHRSTPASDASTDSGSPADGSRMCSSPFAAARLNRATRWPGPGLVPAFQRRTLRAFRGRDTNNAPGWHSFRCVRRCVYGA